MRMVILLVVLLGCATPYQAKGFRGGYQDEAVGDGTYIITVNVNGYTSTSTAFKYFQRRAHEVCVAHGFTSYAVLQTNGVGGDVLTGRIRCTNEPPG